MFKWIGNTLLPLIEDNTITPVPVHAGVPSPARLSFIP
jgi:hypothetical protein